MTFDCTGEFQHSSLLSQPQGRSLRGLCSNETPLFQSELNESVFPEGNNKLDVGFQVQFEALESQGKLDC